MRIFSVLHIILSLYPKPTENEQLKALVVNRPNFDIHFRKYYNYNYFVCFLVICEGDPGKFEYSFKTVVSVLLQ